ncbi:MAG: retroviral-like aspartic protease family protein [Magnetococcales bacterium]|nr:retroviral-like aspartic protease family protein [Magnetococcales bacterium]
MTRNWTMVLVGVWLLSGAELHAADEMVQCADGKGDPTFFRKGECRSLDDPTVPTGKPAPGATSPGATSPGSTSPGATSPGSTSPDATSPGSTSPGATSPGSTSPGAKAEAKDPDEGRSEINPASGEQYLQEFSLGPWRVSQILVPALGEDVRGFEKSALINGYRYRVGERVDGGVIREISRDRVVMVHDGKETVVPFDRLTHASQYGRVGAIPLTRDPDGLYTLKIRINNGHEIEAIVDTGASRLTLPEDVVSWLRRSNTLKESDFIGKANVSFADGSQRETKVFKVASVRVGDMELKDVEAVSVPAEGKESDAGKEKETGKDKDKGKDKSRSKSGSKEKAGSEPDKGMDLSVLNRPLFGIQELKRLGKWRIDHVNDQLIVER